MDTSAHLLYRNPSELTLTHSDGSTYPHTYKYAETHTLTAGTYAAARLQILTVAHIRISN